MTWSHGHGEMRAPEKLVTGTGSTWWCLRPVGRDDLLQQKPEMTFCPTGNFHRKPLLPATRIWLGTTQQTLGLGSQAVPLLGQRLFVSSIVPQARKERSVSATETPRTARAQLGLQRAPEPPISSVSISTPEGAWGRGAAAPTAQLGPRTQSSPAHLSARAGWGHQDSMRQGCTWPPPHAGAS